MGNENGSFKIREFRLLSLHFDINEKYDESVDSQLDINIELGHQYIDKDNVLVATQRVDITGDRAPVTITAKVGGIFDFTEKPATPEALRKTSEITCGAIIFPFLREVVADVTRRAGLAPLILPPMNFVGMYNSNHPDDQVPI